MRGDTTVDVKDVDTIIDIASRHVQRQEEVLTDEDMVDIGRQLNLPEEAVHEAIRTLAMRRAHHDAEMHARQQQRTMRRRILWMAAVGAGFLVVLTLTTSHAVLDSRFAAVEEHTQHVREAVQRAAAVDQQIAHLPLDDVGRMGEQLGAQNRVMVERRRYDQAVADYNQAARGIGGRLARLTSGKPARLPFANEVAQW